MTSAPLFSWLHISDLHFGHGGAGHRWDQRLVLDALLADAAALVKRGLLKPDAIVVTGDVAFSGAPAQYNDAFTWMERLTAATGAKTVVSVPGNHDVNRAVDRDRGTARLVRALREGQEDLDAALEDESDQERLKKRMQAYLEFAERCHTEWHDLALAHPWGDLWWSGDFAMNDPGGILRFAGLNTALLSADEKDKGRLRLGKAMIADTIGTSRFELQRNSIVVALSHHPLDRGWLADEREAIGWLRRGAHIHLCGHVHEAESRAVQTGAGTGLVQVVAGAAHGEQMPEGVPVGHGYNLAALVAGEDRIVRLRVWPRKWSDRNKDFRADVDSVDEARGYAEHALTVKVPEPPTEPRESFSDLMVRVLKDDDF
jgi:3',5'-cyclic AMP phosphodiesterase CpdA